MIEKIRIWKSDYHMALKRNQWKWITRKRSSMISLRVHTIIACFNSRGRSFALSVQSCRRQISRSLAADSAARAGSCDVTTDVSSTWPSDSWRHRAKLLTPSGPNEAPRVVLSIFLPSVVWSLKDATVLSGVGVRQDTSCFTHIYFTSVNVATAGLFFYFH